MVDKNFILGMVNAIGKDATIAALSSAMGASTEKVAAMVERALAARDRDRAAEQAVRYAERLVRTDEGSVLTCLMREGGVKYLKVFPDGRIAIRR